MKYISTRGGMDPATFSEVALEGLAPDGGLTYPEEYVKVGYKELKEMSELAYPNLAFSIISPYANDVDLKVIKRILEKTYTKEVFGSDKITPVVEIGDGIYKQDLSGGPTRAFKDIALQFAGNYFPYELERRDDFLNFLGATSGDTGSSAEEGIGGKERMTCFMIFPKYILEKSPFPASQMTTLMDPNIFNIAIEGVFDDGQDLAKAVNRDLGFKEKYHIGGVNSYNWARVVAQIVYYFSGYFQTASYLGEEIDVSVPTGNFGNILAAYIAKQMGLPIRRLILATNENNVLEEAIKTGIYRVRDTEEVIETSSQSMDISKASNFERYLFDMFGRNSDITRQYMEQLEREKIIDLRGTEFMENIQNSGFVSGSSRHKNRVDTIAKTYRNSGYIIDTHTADGIYVGTMLKEDGVKVLCEETARSVKCEPTIKEALGFVSQRDPQFVDLEDRPKKYLEIEKGDINALKRIIEENAIQM
jgi:threonine synthase